MRVRLVLGLGLHGSSSICSLLMAYLLYLHWLVIGLSWLMADWLILLLSCGAGGIKGESAF